MYRSSEIVSWKLCMMKRYSKVIHSMVLVKSASASSIMALNSARRASACHLLTWRNRFEAIRTTTIALFHLLLLFMSVYRAFYSLRYWNAQRAGVRARTQFRSWTFLSLIKLILFTCVFTSLFSSAFSSLMHAQFSRIERVWYFICSADFNKNINVILE